MAPHHPFQRARQGPQAVNLVTAAVKTFGTLARRLLHALTKLASPSYPFFMTEKASPPRTKLFISKATPGDDALASWLAPRLEAQGYEVFADILDLSPGDGWRLKITRTLQDKAVKMLLCCSDETLAREGVIEEIEIAKDLSRSLADPRFIVPLKMQRFKKLFGIGGLQYIDFERNWASGLTRLLEFLEKENVPRSDARFIQLGWAAYRRRQAVAIRREPEVLTSNWLRVLTVPDEIHLVRPIGSLGKKQCAAITREAPFPVLEHANGYLSFVPASDFQAAFPSIGRFETEWSVPYADFSGNGHPDSSLAVIDARRHLVNLFRLAWEMQCRKQGFLQHIFSKGSASIASDGKIGIGKKIQWGRQGQRRSSVLRNIARKKVWEFGVTAYPSLFPFPHYRLKARVLFSELDGIKKGAVIDDSRTQHRLRRSVCSSWRNRAWHGRLMAFLELMAGESPYVTLPTGGGSYIVLDAMPVQVTVPVTARQLHELGEEAEEKDISTLDGYFGEDEA